MVKLVFFELVQDFFNQNSTEMGSAFPSPSKVNIFLLLFSMRDEMDATIPIWDWGMIFFFISPKLYCCISTDPSHQQHINTSDQKSCQQCHQDFFPAIN